MIVFAQSYTQNENDGFSISSCFFSFFFDDFIFFDITTPPSADNSNIVQWERSEHRLAYYVLYRYNINTSGSAV